MQELEYPFRAENVLKNKKSIKRKLIENLDESQLIHKRIAILGGSTTRDLLLMLELFLLNYGIEPEFYESEYDQYYQEAMFPNPELENFKPDLIYIHTSYRNIEAWPSLSDDEQAIDGMLQTVYEKFAAMWEHIHTVYHCQIIQNNFELPFYRILGNRDAYDPHGRTNFVTRLNQKFYGYAYTHENFHIHDILYEQSSYGLDKWSAPYYWHMYKYACDVSAIPYMAFNLAHIIKAIYGKNKKALALDLDNTLWGGVIGDDGADSIEIGQETSLSQTYAEFQQYVKELKGTGVLLAIDSKNEHDTAMEGLRREDSVLHENDFVSIYANWESKDVNLKKIAADLNIFPESIVFADDNPAERHMVRENVPGCEAPELNGVENYIHTIDRNGYFEVTTFSEDDAKRSKMYQENAKRAQAQAAFSDYGEYLKSLEMKGTIRKFEPAYMSRIAQLTNKSNQFNLTTRRYNQSEIEDAASDPMRITLYGKLEDKFGDNGVVSVVIGSKKKGCDGLELHIDLWLMSCRVLKRDMEYAMMDELVTKCRENEIWTIIGYYYPTKKNGMVKDFYAKQGFSLVSEDQEGNAVWEFKISDDYDKKNGYIEVN